MLWDCILAMKTSPSAQSQNIYPLPREGQERNQLQHNGINALKYGKTRPVENGMPNTFKESENAL